MLYWLNEQTERKPHPSTQWVEWKNDLQKFRYWDREKKEQWLPKDEQYVDVELPKEFVVVAEWHSVGWYVEQFNTWVRSNEILNFNDPLIVRKNDGTIWLKWTWKEIGDAVKSAWARLQKHIHYTTTDSLDLKTIILTWAWVSAWINAIQEKTLSPITNRVKFKEAWTWKKWRVEYSFPVFESWAPLDQNDINLRKALATSLDEYNKEAINNVQKDIKETSAEKAIEDNTLPF